MCSVSRHTFCLLIILRVLSSHYDDTDPVPPKTQNNPKTPEEFGDGSLWKTAELPLSYATTPQLVWFHRRGSRDLFLGGLCELWKLQNLASLTPPSPSRFPLKYSPHPLACVLGFIRRQLRFGALPGREGTATSTGRRGPGKERNTAEA